MYPYPGAPLTTSSSYLWTQSTVTPDTEGWQPSLCMSFAPADWSQNRTCVFRSHTASLPVLIHCFPQKRLAIFSDLLAKQVITTTSDIAGLCLMASTISGDLYQQLALEAGDHPLCSPCCTAALGRRTSTGDSRVGIEGEPAKWFPLRVALGPNSMR